jgi:hypothetical protein
MKWSIMILLFLLAAYGTQAQSYPRFPASGRLRPERSVPVAPG